MRTLLVLLPVLLGADGDELGRREPPRGRAPSAGGPGPRPGAHLLQPADPALSPGGKTLLVPDRTLGLFALPIAGGPPAPIAGPQDLVTGGIDGLFPAPGGLLAVQDGIVVPRLVRLWLDRKGRRITRWTVLARGPACPTRRRWWSGATGRWPSRTTGGPASPAEGTGRPGAPTAGLRLLRLDLH